nr:hypothetical protein [Algicella marina]
MIVKAVTFFLIAMVVLAIFGKLRLPKPGAGGKRIKTARKCRSCGGYVVGDGPCPCGKGS